MKVSWKSSIVVAVNVLIVVVVYQLYTSYSAKTDESTLSTVAWPAPTALGPL